MSNGTVPTPTNGSANGSDLRATASSGIKLLSEAVIPGGSLLIEKNIGGGLGVAAVGLLGGAAMGAVFGPLGFLLTRVGASAISYNAAVKGPTPPSPTTQALNQSAAAMQQTAAATQQSATVIAKLSDKLDNIPSAPAEGLRKQSFGAGQASTGLSAEAIAEGMHLAFAPSPPPPPPPPYSPPRPSVADALAEAVSRGVDLGISRAVPRTIAELEPRVAASAEAGAKQAGQLAQAIEDLSSVMSSVMKEFRGKDEGLGQAQPAGKK